jgi:hypothetical protein
VTGVFCECGIQVPEHRLNQSSEIIRLRVEVDELKRDLSTSRATYVLAQNRYEDADAERRSLRDRLKAISPETPRPKPPNCDCGHEAKPGWIAQHGNKQTGCLHTRVQEQLFDYSNGHPVSGGRELCMCSISDPPCVAHDGTPLDRHTPGIPFDDGSCPECGGDPIPGRPYLCNCPAWGTDE